MVLANARGEDSRVKFFDFSIALITEDEKIIVAGAEERALQQYQEERAKRVAKQYRFLEGQPCAELRTGYQIPLVGLGTWKSAPGDVCKATKVAIRSGYRHIDAAEIYRNEHEVGDALQDIFQESVVNREHIFVTSKLWNDCHPPNKVKQACLKSLRNLKLNYLDLYLIHWPVTQGPWGHATINESWQAMEELVDEGLVRSIGVSNFSIRKLQLLTATARIKPAVCQVEIHPYHRNDDLIRWCAANNIHVTAYSPLGSPDSAQMFKRSAPVLMENEDVQYVAKAVGRNVGQVLIRWALQHGTSVLPKSTSAERIQSNLDLFNWSLPEEHFQRLCNLRPQVRMVDGSFLLSTHGEFRTLEDLWDSDLGEGAATESVQQTTGNQLSVKLSSGFCMPLIGLGTWKSRKGLVREAVEQAIRCGYRHIDTAKIYNNEDEVGDALAKVMQAGVVTREDIFVTSKLWNTDHGGNVVAACKKSMEKLKVAYLDLYLIHWPATGNVGPQVTPPLQDTWKEMESLVKEGLVRSIGVSNFSVPKLIRIMEQAELKPAVNQVEVHPYHRNDNLIQWCQGNGIHVTAYSPLGSPDSAAMFRRSASTPVLLEDPVVKDIAATVGKSPGQVLIRWGIQRGTSVLPKSTTKERIESNLSVQDWELPSEEFNQLSSLQPQMRMVDASFLCSSKGPYTSLREFWDEGEE